MLKQVRINKPIDGITNVVLASFGNLVINQGSENSLIIKTTEKIEKFLICKKEGNTLTLEIENNDPWLYRFIGLFDNPKNNCLTYFLTLKNINEVISEGSGNITFESCIASENFKLKLKASGNIDLKKVNASSLALFSSGSGNLRGESLKADNNIQLTVKGRGDIDLKDVNASEIEMNSSGSGNFKAESMKVSNQAKLKLSGSGNIKIDNLIINSLESEIIGKGDVMLSGVAKFQCLTARGSGDYSSKKFKTETAKIKQGGSGDISVNVTKSISATSTGTGNLKVRGNPSERSVKISGTGNLKYSN